jgi:hypothetical protein
MVVQGVVSVESRVLSKTERTVSAILLPFQQKSVHIIVDPFFRVPCPFDHLPITPYKRLFGGATLE